MSIKKLVILVVVLVLVSSVAVAGYMFMPEEADSELSGAFCKELDDKSTYAKNNMDNYSVLIPGKNGWIFRTENDFRADYTLNDKTKKYLVSLTQALKSKGSDLVIVFPPARGLIHSDELLRQYKRKYDMEKPAALWDNYENSVAEMQRAGIAVVGIKKNEAIPDYFYKRNHHWSASGSRLTAQKTAQLIKLLPSYQSLPKIKFRTVNQEAKPYDSSFEKAFRKICGTKVPNEIAASYTTISDSSGAALNETSLFDDNSDPEVVLLGTSNSIDETSSANFEGFLKEALSADILNNAFIGGGIDTGIMSYLNSEHYKKGHGKVLIWEVPGHYDFNVMDDKLFNQIIPAAYGSCSQNALAQFNISNLAVGENQVLDLSDAASPQNITSYHGPLYMHLAFSNPVKQKFAVEFEYTGGGTKRQEFTRSSRYPQDGDFYTLFPMSNTNSGLSKIKLALPRALNGTQVQVQVCPLPTDNILAKAFARDT
jgi:alginate biosynthesis protein AlgX